MKLNKKTVSNEEILAAEKLFTTGLEKLLAKKADARKKRKENRIKKGKERLAFLLAKKSPVSNFTYETGDLDETQAEAKAEAKAKAKQATRSKQNDEMIALLENPDDFLSFGCSVTLPKAGKKAKSCLYFSPYFLKEFYTLNGEEPCFRNYLVAASWAALLTCLSKAKVLRNASKHNAEMQKVDIEDVYSEIVCGLYTDKQKILCLLQRTRKLGVLFNFARNYARASIAFQLGAHKGTDLVLTWEDDLYLVSEEYVELECEKAFEAIKNSYSLSPVEKVKMFDEIFDTSPLLEDIKKWDRCVKNFVGSKKYWKVKNERTFQ